MHIMSEAGGYCVSCQCVCLAPVQQLNTSFIQRTSDSITFSGKDFGVITLHNLSLWDLTMGEHKFFVSFCTSCSHYKLKKYILPPQNQPTDLCRIYLDKKKHVYQYLKLKDHS